MCFLLKVELYQLGTVHCPAMLEMCFLAKVEMCYSERVGSVSIRMLLGLDMEGSQSPGFLAAEALANHEAVSAFSSGQLLNGACSHWGISVSMLELRLAFED
jgi:hypothetical protein